jgi:uncharacterized protein (TIGR02001 family)
VTGNSLILIINQHASRYGFGEEFMKNLQKTVIASSLLLVTAGAVAEDKSPVAANVALTTNYVWRGVSQTAEEMALQGGFDYAHASGFYIGTWGSNVNFGDTGPVSAYTRAQLELDVYAGYKFSGAGVNWDVGAIRYMYPGADDSFKYDFTEVYVGGGYGPFSLKYSNASDYQGNLTTKSGNYLDAALTFELPQGFGLGLHVGKSSGQGVQDAFGKKYTDYKVSLSKTVAGIGLGLAYTDTNMSGAQEIKKGVSANDGQWMLTVSKSM